ncbi:MULTISPECIES: flavin reductase family protein [unclassified Burkholderia]|uniref:flavin reductase family protein n=1 Tax=unclassified Burkholderia TaxID=2613784 RepID=UPI00141E618D|nr:MULTISPECIES: flavin reductase family protein [unclassified Burkholderia]NIE57310.1 flavin reductase family protein [Burkholderia sp. Ap-955]NIF08036.1 flavin reductase family protein [Burkholderia sp. Ax-1735]NIG02040.1 flavin reductase family protein [Burkholderia sp. Tr-849]
MSTHDTVTRPDCGSSVDTRALRTALGSFATGVAIITARAPDGCVIGLTVNSFNSVSMEPPLIVWSLSRTSSRFDAFQQVTHYAAHVLALDQVELAQRFATSVGDKFLGLVVSPGLGGAPLLEGCSARFECQIASRIDAGDHRMFIGSVERFSAVPRKPLVYHGGRYRELSAQD